ncbi:non-homologous end-joining DNA ligase [Desulfallas sp. Bu1-1]|jgi:bifunctional non-homologous end joining protein LigD|nr:non-homologous end-joining DNA ligase [Desulfallas sp. Bu1-1]
MVEIEGHALHLTNLEKVFWPDQNLTKAHMIKYYMEIAPLLLSYIYNRPLVMKRYPDGIHGDFFYQKECPFYAPEWIETYPVKHTHKVINYIVCNNVATLVWMANQGCLEIHGWLSRSDNIDYPDLAVIDLDPAEGVPFREVMRVALIVREALNMLGISGYPKTSGSSGMHIFIPLSGEYTFSEVAAAMKHLAEIIVGAYPDGVTVERNVIRRSGKVYMDYLQNGRGKTMAFPYSLRPEPGAPVSTPLTWDEVEEMNIDPGGFNILTIFDRVKKTGDIFSGMFANKQSLKPLLKIAPDTANSLAHDLQPPNI